MRKIGLGVWAVVLLCMGFAFPAMSAPAGASGCDKVAVGLQVLGSGGPIPLPGRASAGYLLWIGGKARVLIDAGGGVFLRFGEAGANLADLDAVLITHLHTDHVADLVALLKSGYFTDRDRALTIFGPNGNERFPGMREFLDAHFDADKGSYRYLRGFNAGDEGLFRLDVFEIGSEQVADPPRQVSDGVQMQAVSVVHGPVPSLGFRLDITLAEQRYAMALSGDQNLSTSTFTALADGVDLLVMPMAIGQVSTPVQRTLHATPRDIGLAAGKARAARLLVSHFMPRSLASPERQRVALAEGYHGEVIEARDLLCLPLQPVLYQ
ncbi:MAG: MBL fold metallo-hydrolase [Xanthomonadales bacterium]|nr:MBL fold metallo-hydrolase [Xanthomonadales bacterium]